MKRKEKSAMDSGSAAGVLAADEETNQAISELEAVAGYQVHPLAAKFPLVVGQEFDDMVESAARARRLPAAELHEGLLIDGRNRLRVQEELRSREIEIEVPVVEWRQTGDETVEEHIWAVNNNRRHLTADQRAALATAFMPEIKKSRRAKQEASRFGSKGGKMAAAISTPPDQPHKKRARTSQEKDKASSVGQLATLANVSPYKAKQVATLVRDVEAGKADQSDIEAVAAGVKTLREVVPARSKASKKKPKKNTRKKSPAKKRSGGTASSVTTEDDPPPSEDAARRLWEQWTSVMAVADMPSWRRHFLKVIREDQQKYDA
jgi:hypothetical protein